MENIEDNTKGHRREERRKSRRAAMLVHGASLRVIQDIIIKKGQDASNDKELRQQ